ncbi:hypothetical protein [Caulobacter sp.]|uniref:hypothetical protein n=1 Tax=Caulobacter sp. TaxID=78 RepID=UPI002B48B03F|nr:hypothetical protein [Caulobacter sp.]
MGSVGGVVDVSPGVVGFGMVEPPGCGALSVGGVDGMLGGAADGEGLTDVSVGVDGAIMELVGSLGGVEAVAEVSVDMPVEAPAEPDHQSLLVRALGEAFM